MRATIVDSIAVVHWGAAFDSGRLRTPSALQAKEKDGALQAKEEDGAGNGAGLAEVG